MSARPTILATSYDVTPQQMRLERRWVLWRNLAGRKRPFTVMGTSADSTDPATWSSFGEAITALQSGTYTGLGFVLGDGFAGIDLDDVRDPSTGKLHPEAVKLIELSGSYAEVSPSGTGVKIFGSGQWAGFNPGVVHRVKSDGTTEAEETSATNRRPFADGEIEVYCDQRYFTVTGQRIGGEFCDLSPAFEVLRSQYSGQPIADKATRQKPAPAAAEAPTPHTPTVLVADVNPLLGDDQIIAIASRSKNGDAFTALWNGDLAAYDGDHSRADLTLCQYLAFYTHNDPARLDRLFRRSKLFRDKWGRGDYRNRTLMQAISSCRKFWDPSNVVPYDNPHRLARQFLEEHPTLKYWNGEYLLWVNGVYKVTADAVIRGLVTNSVEREFELGYQEQIARYQAQPEDQRKKPPSLMHVTVAIINNVMQALNGLCCLDLEPPCWIEDVGGADPLQMISFRNGLLDVETGQFYEPNSAFFTLNAMPYDYDASAAEPTAWLKFLESLWGNYKENTDTLQEWFGYCTIPDNQYQKMMFLVGPTRAGKGVILRTLTDLVGGGQSAKSVTLAGLASQFGLQGLAGSLVTQITDARFGGNRAESAAVLERILSITGGDLIPIDRKHRTSIYTQLCTRLTIASNELPEIRDASAAFVTRFIVIDFVRTFEKSPDSTLSKRIAKEMPGIFNWAYAGLRRLRARGYFLQPSRAESHIKDLNDITSPISVFLREECTFEPEAYTPKKVLYDAYLKHATAYGWSHTMHYERFCKDLRAARYDLTVTKRGPKGGQVPVWVGVRFKTEQEKDAD
mgnify:CR=1 FL=1